MSGSRGAERGAGDIRRGSEGRCARERSGGGLVGLASLAIVCASIAVGCEVAAVDDAGLPPDGRDAGLPSADGSPEQDRDAGQRDAGRDAGRRDAGREDAGRDAGTTGGSAGCGAAGARREAWTFRSGGREAVIAAPAGYDPNTPYPIVIAYHGGGDNGPSFRGWSGVEGAAGGGAIFVYPSGPGGVWESEVYSGDFAFVRAAVAQVFDEYCADPSAVFAYGFSWGGWAATQMACAAGDLVRGVVSIAGGGPMGSCGEATAVMLIHGRGDTAEQFSSSESSLRRFRGTNGCSDGEAPFDPSPCATHTGCDASLVWCWHGGGHEIPGFAPGAIWRFFQGLR